jgi:glycosyltransferase involved in cell wall biosynthesis
MGEHPRTTPVLEHGGRSLKTDGESSLSRTDTPPVPASRTRSTRRFEARSATLLLPGGIERLTGGNLYDGIMVAALRNRGWRVDVAEQRPRPDVDVVIQDSLSIPAGPPDGEAPLVALLHQIPSDANGRADWRPAEDAVLQRASVVIAVSDHIARSVSARAGAPVAVIPPGWDRAWARRRSEDEEVLCVANATPVKAVPDALEAFRRANLDHATFTLVGETRRDPSEWERIRAAASRDDSAVVLRGLLPPDALAERYAAARVMLSASGYEGWPIAIAEAMASAVPVVAFDAPGVRELVRDGVDGLLVEPGDVDSLAGALRRLWDEPALRSRLGVEARRRATAWPRWQSSSARFVEVIEALVADAQPSTSR